MAMAVMEEEESEEDKEHRCHVILLAGPPASGKSTLGRKLESHFGYTHFDIGKHIRENMPPTADLEDFALSSVEHILRNNSYVLLNGFPKYRHGLILLNRRFEWVQLELCLWLQVPDSDELARRATARHISGERPEDDDANFRTRLRIYEEETIPTIRSLDRLSVMEIDASRPEDSVEALAIDAWKVAGLRLGRRLQGSGSRERRDAEEADFEVIVSLMSGEERLRPLLPARAAVRTLRRVLVADGETEFNLKFFFEGREILDPEILCFMHGFTIGCTIFMVREEKPPPPPPPPGRRDYRDSPPVCFTGDSIACILDSRTGRDVPVPLAEVKIGDLVRTSPKNSRDSYCRVERVWMHEWSERVQIFQVAQGCRLTAGHPVLRNGKWYKPESLCKGEWHIAGFVYQLETEGHVDIALVGGVQCALLGCYCGPDFGWNVFTRKTVKCKKPCSKCDKAYVPGLSFSPSELPVHMLPPATFEPY